MVIRSLRRHVARSVQRQRALSLLGVITIWGGLLLTRLLYLQVGVHDEMVRSASAQQTLVIELAGQRGDLYARGGEQLATSVQLHSIYAQPRKIVEPTVVAELLAPPLGMEVATLARRLGGSRSFLYLRRKTRPEITATIRALVREHGIDGIGVLPESKRYYPHRSLGAHVVGAVNMDNEGRFGVERYYEDLIGGRAGSFNTLRDGWRNVIGSRGAVLENPTRGYDLELTLDWGLQYAAEEAIRRAVIDKRGVGGSVVAMDPNTGAVLAMASYPTFNLNDNNDPAFVAHQRNQGVAFRFEPGSAFKVITAAAALHEDVVQEDEEIDCEGGRYQVATHTYRDWNVSSGAAEGFGILTFREVLMNSSNVGTIKVCQRLAPDTYYSWIRDFGFGTATGIDLPGEVAGSVQSPRGWSQLTQSSMAFGQELSTTPIQLAAAISAVANGGLLMKPYVLQRVIDHDGTTLERARLADGTEIIPGTPVVRRRVLDKSIANRVALIMEQVVAAGTGEPAALAGYRVAGKTSTAEKFDREARRYSKYVAGFVGFLPVSSPRVVIVAVVDEPQRGTGHGGSQAAAPVFREVAEAAARILRIQPDGLSPDRPWVVGGNASPAVSPTASTAAQN